MSGIYDVETPVQTGPMTSVRSTPGTVQDKGRTTDVGGQHTSALRALAAKSNAVVDIEVIGGDLGDDATMLVQSIRGRIPS
ncbi:hypothetical protein [Mycobacterium sp. E2479]|uniref:hypothetical protein n=1 Tax=Mycobacterium sp. E2479 TaxID=1834134 RepID=UPI0008000315|nr:hypothetical protein [Mycobacterium sp. E2479]OBH50331.1 hypothetical protein A5686_13290 [Mycobacterium sp. E2479]